MKSSIFRDFGGNLQYQVSGPEDLNREVLYCPMCKGKAYLLPPSTPSTPTEILFKILGLKTDEEVISVLKTVLDITTKAVAPDQWPQVECLFCSFALLLSDQLPTLFLLFLCSNGSKQARLG